MLKESESFYWDQMERYATDLTLSFGFCYYFSLWLFSIFLSPALHYRARLPARGSMSLSLSPPLPLKEEFTLYQKL